MKSNIDSQENQEHSEGKGCPHSRRADGQAVFRCVAMGRICSNRRFDAFPLLSNIKRSRKEDYFMKRMSMKLIILMSLVVLGSVAIPTFASAWETERSSLGGKGIYSYGSELFKESELFRESRDKASDTSHSDDIVGPSVNIPPSVDGASRALDRGRSSADPMVQDLSRMDGGGFSSPDSSSWGSVPGYHGR
jgi:hypothetical protein